MSILQDLQNGKTVKDLSMDELEGLCYEIRREILSVVNTNGGHLSSNLGAVELTVAIHYVYDLPFDSLLFDVGHQCYAHKLLSGRAKDFDTLRTYGGISGFPRQEESEYDAYGAGHAGTAISAALGLIRAAKIRGEQKHVIAMVGDGSFMDGPSMEAVNDIGEEPIVVVLNDNNMAISPNVGGLSQYLNRVRSAQGYWNFKSRTANFLKKIPGIGNGLHDFFYKLKNSVKVLFVKGSLFEAIGFTYLGPIDGHDLPMLIRTLKRAKNLNRPVLVHAVTQKGHGYHPAEEEPGKYHGVTPYIVEHESREQDVNYKDVMVDAMDALMHRNPNTAIITAAMLDGTGVEKLTKQYPNRMFDVGIAEAHAVTLACGLASGGVKPYFAVYSTFLQRGYDELLHDVALQNLPVTFLVTNAGLTGQDGATHHGVFDLSFATHLPNVTILAPSCAEELYDMIAWSETATNPVFIRYPKQGCHAMHTLVPLEKSPWQVVSISHRAKAVVLAVGSMVPVAMMAADTLALDGIDIEVVNCRQVKPLPDRMLEKYANLPIITLEENAVIGGFGAYVAVRCGELGLPVRLLPIGVPDHFVLHGTTGQLLHEQKLDVEGVALRIREFIGK